MYEREVAQAQKDLTQSLSQCRPVIGSDVDKPWKLSEGVRLGKTACPLYSPVWAGVGNRENSAHEYKIS